MKNLILILCLLVPGVSFAATCPSDLVVAKLITRYELRGVVPPPWVTNCVSYKHMVELDYFQNKELSEAAAGAGVQLGTVWTGLYFTTETINILD